MNGLGNRFRPGANGSAPGGSAFPTCHDGSRADKWADRPRRRRRSLAVSALRATGSAIASLLCTALDRVAQVALNAHFRRVRIAHRERFPKSGAVLLVANHPSAWADAVVLLGAFGRKLHFLVQGSQFRPWPRGLLLRLFGALPVHARDAHPDAAARNADTFRRCEALFDRGQVVAVFPEGVSETDRSLMPLKLGAARLALGYARRGGPPLAVCAVGLHYSDRVSFRSDVAVNVGEPIDVSELLDPTRDDEADAARLTNRIGWEIRALALGAVRPRQVAVLSALEPIASGVAEAMGIDSPSETLARSLEELEREDPETFRRLERRARRQERIRRALRVSDRALRVSDRASRRSRAHGGGLHVALSGVVTAIGALPAAVGALIHAIPAALTSAAVRRIAGTPAQVAFVRIAAGAVFFLAGYAAAGWLLFFRLGLGAETTGGILLLCAILGACALAYTPHAREWSERWRLGWVALRHLDLVCRAHREEEWLRRRVEMLLEYGLEVADVDPAHAPVLELGARPSPLPR